VRAALDHDVERFVYVSSSMVFERATEYPTTEEHIGECPIPRSAYGFSKLTGEVYVRAAHDEHGLPYTICRPFNAYGPGEMPEDEPGIAHMVPDVIRKCLTLPEGAPLPIFGDGTHTRTLTHIDDIADGIVAAMASPKGLCEDFNISASDERTVAELAEVIWKACGRDPETFALEHLTSFEVDVVRRWPSVDKARRRLGWEARIGLERGIAETVAWLRDTLAQPTR
jgi:UDP-glucose 4-epimerase